ncbi:MAG: sugar phosphate isomerase/epimerase [Clostridiales bacterium]|jgi:sugar phosphate isomerase/epimerase|nr:sugar phosphate isomerase/epimerase [Clostridiales bacterium]
MKLSFSNIAWSSEQDEEMYSFLQSRGFVGLEIAPTRIFPDSPYERLDEARTFAIMLREHYGLTVASMQSIWYGRNESIFGTDEGRIVLADYTRKAVDFAVAVGWGNLVFGCPKNRNIPDGFDRAKAHDIAHEFLAEIGGYACANGIMIALEPNPPIYGTNFINRTAEAFELARGIDGIMVNIDCGTIIENSEDIQIITNNIELVNHIHISEPNLVMLEKRALHRKMAKLLIDCDYDKYVSVEMKDLGDVRLVKQAAEYVAGVFGGLKWLNS